METLPSKSASSLRWFANGHHIDVCIDICNQIGQFFPSEQLGIIIKQSQVQTLFIRGFIDKELTESFGVSYWRFRISESGQQHVKAYKHACSK